MCNSIEIYFISKLQNFILYKKNDIILILKNIKKYINKESIIYKSIIENNLLLNIKSNNDFISHLSSGGYGFIFKLDNIFCIKIQLSEYNYEWIIPKEIERILIETKNDDLLKFINIPISIFENYFLYGLYQSYIFNCMIFYLIDIILNKKKINKNDFINILQKLNQKTIILDLYNKNVNNKNFLNLYTQLYYSIFKNINYPIIFNNNFEKFLQLFLKITKNKDVNKLDLNDNIKSFDEMVLLNLKNEFINTKLNKEEKKKIIKNKKIFKDKIIKENENLECFFGNLIIQYLAKGNFYSIYIDENNNIVPSNISKINAMYTPKYIKLFIFQVLYSISNINKITGFLHGDLKPDNILVYENKTSFIITINNINFYFSENYIFKINDYDFSNTLLIKNNLIKDSQLYNITNIFNDIHFLFITLFKKKSYIDIFLDIYKDYYNYLIKNKCDICDNNYNKILNNKLETIESHYNLNIIKHEDILFFLKDSKLFIDWKVK